MSMHAADYVKVAFQNLRRQKLRNLLAVSAIIIGAASITVMLALVVGAKSFYFNQFKSSGKLDQVLVNSQTDLSFEAAQHGSNCSDCTKLTDDIAAKIKDISHVRDVAPTVDLNMFESASLDGNKQTVNGAQSYSAGGVIQPMLLAGRQFEESDGRGTVLVNQYVADKWGYTGKYGDLIGKSITLTTSPYYSGEGAALPDPVAQFKQCQNSTCNTKTLTDQLKPTTLSATVVGVVANERVGFFVPLSWGRQLVESRYYEISDASQTKYRQAFTAWDAKRRVGAEPVPEFSLITKNQITDKGYSTLVVAADDQAKVDSVAQEIRGLGVGAASVLSYLKAELEVFDVVGLILGAMGAIALIVAAIGVVNTMVTAILERTREIGVMRAIGAKRSTISKLFTIEAGLLGFLGGLFGVLAGFGLIVAVNVVVNAQLADSGLASRNVIGLPVWIILMVVSSTTIIGTLAGLYPARRAARLDPVEALRHQ